MKKYIFITILLFLSQCVAKNPGLVTAVKREIIDKVADQYLVSAFDTFGYQEIPDIKDGDIKVQNIKATIKNHDSKNLITSFHKDLNAIGVDLKNTEMDVDVKWKYSKAFISLSGSAKVTGTLQDMGMKIVMSDTTEGQDIIPQIKVQNMNIKMDKSHFHLKLKCSGCPGEVEKWISSWMKGTMLDTIRDQIKKQVPQQANTMGNKMLKEQYPKTFTLYDNIDLATALTQAIVVEDDHLEIHLDGTFFPHDQGYKRPSEPTEMPHFNPSDPGEIMMFFSSYLAETLSTTLDTETQIYYFKILGISCQASLDPEAGNTKVIFEDGDFHVEAHPKLSIPSLGLGLNVGGAVKLRMKISTGDKKNMMSVTPSIKKLALSTLSIDTPLGNIDLNVVRHFLNIFVKGLMNYLVIPKIAIPKQELLPLHVTDSELDFHQIYSELGLLFEFN